MYVRQASQTRQWSSLLVGGAVGPNWLLSAGKILLQFIWWPADARGAGLACARAQCRCQGACMMVPAAGPPLWPGCARRPAGAGTLRAAAAGARAPAFKIIGVNPWRN